ncbi:TonB-dependent receptor [Aridibaculum aurantiacum]|uniref:TonB-dependent receptor n=1 Tax=Aridibaculum aurantiacum TaxID=2810307 RepID=UPI001A969578|nr:TonB-dependent receptor [Aridibaculum aurantiacum]
MKMLVPALFALVAAQAQQPDRPARTDTLPARDSLLIEMKDQIMDNIPVISLDEGGMGDGQNISSILTAGRDPFFSAASFNFSAVRFRLRGYDNDLNTTFMNGIPMDNLDNGFTPFGLWGGLNDVMRNRELNLGLRPNTFAFGDIGSNTNIDARASRQRKQTSFGYALSNRAYTHRFNFTHSTGISKKGWAFTVSGSRRWADEGYVPGTYYNGWSYFFAVDKKISNRHTLSFTAFGAPTENGRQTGAVMEAMELTGSHYYNPAWGYQEGKKRNANVAKTHQPFFIFTHDFRINNSTTLTTAAGYSTGERSTTALDWYNAADPRPDYYRYLPSYQQDPAVQQQAREAIMANPNLLQINWLALYEANRGNWETIRNVNGIAGNDTSGRRSRYVLQDRVIATNRFNANTVLNTRVSDHLEFSAGATFQAQRNNYFNRVNDLLGGAFYVDLNQFAERDFPNNPNVNQNDLNRPNRIVGVGDKYGHNYDINVRRASAWAQGVFKFSKVDFFLSGELSNTNFYRVGNVRNGLYPNNSFGKSSVNNFTNYALKGGMTYKIDGRNYVYANAARLTRAPFFENVYIAPRTRDFIQDNTTSETVTSVEGGYVLNAPRVKLRLSGYYTNFDNQMNVMTFFHDEVRNFVNYALSNIDKVHFGTEFGMEAKILPNVTMNAAASIGRYYFNSRQNAIVTVDNNSSTLDVDRARQTIYSQNFRVSSTPQEAYSLGFTYRSPKYWFVSLTGNYFDQMWLEFNPIRRTQGAVDGLDLNDKPQAEMYRSIIDQTRWDPQFTLDFFGGYSWKLPRRYNLGSNSFLVFNGGVSNLTNNQDIITGGFEQLRFDFATRNVNKFPPRVFYSFGLNYFVGVTYRF